MHVVDTIFFKKQSVNKVIYVYWILEQLWLEVFSTTFFSIFFFSKQTKQQNKLNSTQREHQE